MARRRITQETFDAVVKENMDDFEMDPDDALKDAVEQFDSQGNVLTSNSLTHSHSDTRSSFHGLLYMLILIPPSSKWVVC